MLRGNAAQHAHAGNRRKSLKSPQALDGPTTYASTGEHSQDAASSPSGWGGIRTHGTVTRTAVFKTAAFDHSATHP